MSAPMYLYFHLHLYLYLESCMEIICRWQGYRRDNLSAGHIVQPGPRKHALSSKIRDNGFYQTLEKQLWTIFGQLDCHSMEVKLGKNWGWFGSSWYMLPGIALNCLIGKCPAPPVIYSFTSCCTPPHTTQKLLLGLGMWPYTIIHGLEAGGGGQWTFSYYHL